MSDPLRIRKARIADLPAIESMYAEVIDTMVGTPSDCQWRRGRRPTHGHLVRAIERGDLFVGTWRVDGTEDVAGAFVLDDDIPDDYDAVPWLVDVAPDEVAVLHLLAVSPAARGDGIARRLMHAARQAALQRGAKALRLDVFPNNEPAIRLYRSCGMDDLGLHPFTFPGCEQSEARLFELDLR